MISDDDMSEIGKMNNTEVASCDVGEVLRRKAEQMEVNTTQTQDPDSK